MLIQDIGTLEPVWMRPTAPGLKAFQVREMQFHVQMTWNKLHLSHSGKPGQNIAV